MEKNGKVQGLYEEQRRNVCRKRTRYRGVTGKVKLENYHKVLQKQSKAMTKYLHKKIIIGA